VIIPGGVCRSVACLSCFSLLQPLSRLDEPSISHHSGHTLVRHGAIHFFDKNYAFIGKKCLLHVGVFKKSKMNSNMCLFALLINAQLISNTASLFALLITRYKVHLPVNIASTFQALQNYSPHQTGFSHLFSSPVRQQGSPHLFKEHLQSMHTVKKYVNFQYRSAHAV